VVLFELHRALPRAVARDAQHFFTAYGARAATADGEVMVAVGSRLVIPQFERPQPAGLGRRGRVGVEQVAATALALGIAAAVMRGEILGIDHQPAGLGGRERHDPAGIAVVVDHRPAAEVDRLPAVVLDHELPRHDVLPQARIVAHAVGRPRAEMNGHLGLDAGFQRAIAGGAQRPAGEFVAVDLVDPLGVVLDGAFLADVDGAEVGRGLDDLLEQHQQPGPYSSAAGSRLGPGRCTSRDRASVWG